MLDLNILPKNLVQFVVDFDLQRPDTEKAKQWWNELNQFLETFEFPVPEMKEKFYKGHHAKLKTLITAIEQEAILPLHGFLILKTPMELLLINLLGEEFEHMDHVELTTQRDRIYAELRVLSIPDVVSKVESYINKSPKGNTNLYKELLTLKPTAEDLKHNLEKFLNEGATKGHYTLLALGCARIEILANSDDQDLKSKIEHHYRQRPFTLNHLNEEEMKERGYQSALVRLNYVYTLEREKNIAINIPGKPMRQEGGSLYDEAFVNELRELSSNREEFLNSKHPGKLYSRVHNARMWYTRHLQLSELKLNNEYNYALSALTLEEHYRQVSAKLKERVIELKELVIKARNASQCHELVTYFNVVAINLDEHLENMTNAKSKRSFKHTLGLVNALECTIKVITALDEVGMMKAIEVLKFEHLQKDRKIQTQNVFWNNGFTDI